MLSNMAERLRKFRTEKKVIGFGKKEIIGNLQAISFRKIVNKKLDCIELKGEGVMRKSQLVYPSINLIKDKNNW